MIKDSLSIFGSRLVASVAMLGVGVVIARALGPDGRGQYAVIMATLMLLQLLANLGLTFSNVYHLGQGSLDVSAVVAASIYVGLAASFVLIAVTLLLFSVLRSTVFDGTSSSSILIGLASLPMIVIAGSLNAVNLARRRMLLFNAINLLQAVLNLALVTGFLYGLQLGINSVMSAWLVATTVSLVASLSSVMIGQDRSQALSPRVARQSAPVLLSYGLKGQVGNIAQFMNNRIDQLLVIAWAGSAQLGLYAAAVSVGEAFRFMPDAISTILFSRTSAMQEEQARRTTVRAFKLTLAFAIPWSIAMFALSGIVIRLLYGADFDPAVTATRILIPGVGLLMSSSVLGAFIAGRGKVMLNSWVTVIGLAVTITLDILLIPRWGIVGAAAASLASYSVSACVMVGAYFRTIASPVETSTERVPKQRQRGSIA